MVVRRTPSKHAHGRSEVWELPGLDAALRRERRRLAFRLRALRSKRGWTQEQAAERAGLHPQHVVRLENARANPALPTLVALAVAYRVAVQTLFEDT